MRPLGSEPVDKTVDSYEKPMVSPYLERALRSYEQALNDRASRHAPLALPIEAGPGDRRTPADLREAAPAQLLLRVLQPDSAATETPLDKDNSPRRRAA